MKIVKSKDEKGNPVLNKKGEECHNYFLEVGDLFVPQWNLPIGRDETYKDEKGEWKTSTFYTLKAVVQDSNGKKIIRKEDNTPIIYINLSEGQAKSLITRVENARKQEKEKEKELGRELIQDEKYFPTQHLFKATSYKNEKGTFVGIQQVPKKPKPKSFEDFEDSNSPKGEDEQIEDLVDSQL